MLPPRGRLRQLVLRAATPCGANGRPLFGTGFQRRCVQQALFLLVRNPTCAPLAVEIGIALEASVSSMRIQHINVLMRALHPEFAVPSAILANPAAKKGLLTAVLDRAGALVDKHPADTAFMGSVLHFVHTRRLSHTAPPSGTILKRLAAAKVIPPATWLALFNFIVGIGFNRECRELLARFATDCVDIVVKLTPNQLQTLLYDLTAIVERYPAARRPVSAVLAATCRCAPDMPARGIVACLYSSHLAGIETKTFAERVIPFIEPDLLSLSQWELLQLTVAVENALRPPANDAFWSALRSHAASVRASLDWSVEVALLARFAEPSQFAELDGTTRKAVRQWVEAAIERLMAIPPPEWRTRELRRLRAIMNVVRPDPLLESRLVSAANAHLPRHRSSERSAIIPPRH